MAKNWPKNFGKRAAQIHQGGPDYGGPSWAKVAEQLSEEFNRPITWGNARDNGRHYLRTRGWARWGVPVESDEAGISTRAYGNYMEITYTPKGRPRIFTVPQLLDFIKADLDVWVVEQGEATSWEVGAKSRDMDMTYVDGVGTGYIKKGPLEVEQLFRVFVRLVKRVPEPVRPSIQPVRGETTFDFQPVTRQRADFTRTLSLGDQHFGFLRDIEKPMRLIPLHDRRALSICLQVAEDVKPDVVVIGGDHFDFAEMGKYTKTPTYRYLLQPAIYELHSFLVQLRKICPTAEIVAIEGNHDERMWKHQKEHSDWACDLRKATESEGPAALSVPNLLDLDSLGIRWIGNWPNGEYWVGDVRFIHGDVVRSQPGATAAAVLACTDWSTVFFHIHRAEEANRTIWQRGEARNIFAVTPACTCRIDGPVPARTNRENWQQGLLIADIYDNGHPVDKHIIRIANGIAHYGGVRYEGVEQVPPLVREWGG